MTEIWRPAPAGKYNPYYCGRWKYEVSNLGRIRISPYINNKGIYRSEKILKQQKNQEGYHTVCLSDGHGDQKRFLVHRLVAECFCPKITGKDYVNHLDEDKDNNEAQNLEWCTWHENLFYGTRIQRASQKRCKPVMQFTKSGVFVAEYSSAREAERMTGIHNALISAVCTHRPHCLTIGGYVWRFKTEVMRQSNGDLPN